MSIVITLFAAALGTATLSGIFGMGGGMVLMGILAAIFPISTAMILHGGTQLGANAYRAALLRPHIQWRLVGQIGIGALLALATLVKLQLALDVGAVYIMLGAVPIGVLLLPRSIHLTIERRSHAIGCGYAFVGLQLLAGASGPILDAFFLRTKLTRFEIVATKSAISSVGHILKLLYWGFLLSTAAPFELGWWIFAVTISAAFVGTRLGRRVLTKLSEQQFRRYSVVLVVAIAIAYLVRGFGWQIDSQWLCD